MRDWVSAWFVVGAMGGVRGEWGFYGGCLRLCWRGLVGGGQGVFLVSWGGGGGRCVRCCGV